MRATCCLVCGETLKQPVGGGRPRTTCSDPCRTALCRRRRREQRERVVLHVDFELRRLLKAEVSRRRSIAARRVAA